jgi:predicted ester cyclase
MATAAEREAQVRHFFDVVWNQRRYEEADNLYDSAYVNLHAPGLTGGEAKCAHLRVWHTAFPDVRLSIEHLVATPDEVAVQFVVEGTDTGGWQGRPATGRRVRVWGVQIEKFGKDRVTEEWVGADYLGLFEQLGVVASPWQSVVQPPVH